VPRNQQKGQGHNLAMGAVLPEDIMPKVVEAMPNAGCRTNSTLRYPRSRMLALHSVARSPAMAFMSRAGTPALS
jgi:hypothetical protein